MSTKQTDHTTPSATTTLAKLMARIKRYIRLNCDEAALSAIKKNTHTLSKRNYISLILYMRRINTYLDRTIEYIWSKYRYINVSAYYTIWEYKAFSKNDIFIDACIGSNIGLVKLLLADREVAPNLHDGRAIEIACSKKDPNLLKILLDDGRCNPTRANNFAITLALRDLVHDRYNVQRVSDYIETLRLMLQDRRIDPIRNNSSLIAEACVSGIIELVRILLEYGIDPGEYSSMAIRHAAKVQDNHEIISLLLQDERVDPTEYNNEALENAVMYGGILNVRALLSDSRVVTNTLRRSIDYAKRAKLDEIHALLDLAYETNATKK